MCGMDAVVLCWRLMICYLQNCIYQNAELIFSGLFMLSLVCNPLKSYMIDKHFKKYKLKVQGILQFYFL